VKGALPPTDLRSGSSLVQISKTGHGPMLSFVDAASVNKTNLTGVPGAHNNALGAHGVHGAHGANCADGARY
jgi:hypothetical protein